MDLKKLLNHLIESEGVPKSEIVWDEVDYFLREHSGHREYELKIATENGRIIEIYAECEGSPGKPCDHRDAVTVELMGSTFYSSIKSEICSELERKRREGTLNLG